MDCEKGGRERLLIKNKGLGGGKRVGGVGDVKLGRGGEKETGGEDVDVAAFGKAEGS